MAILKDPRIFRISEFPLSSGGSGCGPVLRGAGMPTSRYIWICLAFRDSLVFRTLAISGFCKFCKTMQSFYADGPLQFFQFPGFCDFCSFWQWSKKNAIFRISEFSLSTGSPGRGPVAGGAGMPTSKIYLDFCFYWSSLATSLGCVRFDLLKLSPTRSAH